ncbi:galanin receptor type 2-like [Gigantopelta aegis]|uniref:galanin receptor type 2-like n=1 Tax=Gigantopelta aegis TaxID=1735272 RepID=UPI001B88CDE3|nr:galanin receptor type 2-like [Gigantopelta aegis]
MPLEPKLTEPNNSKIIKQYTSTPSTAVFKRRNGPSTTGRYDGTHNKTVTKKANSSTPNSHHTGTSQDTATRSTGLEKTTFNSGDVADYLTESSTFNTTCGKSVSVRRKSVYWISYMEQVSVPVATVVGLLGNTATFVALQGDPFSNMPSSYILGSLAIVDSSRLVTILFKEDFFIAWVGSDVVAASRTWCKTFVWFVHCTKILSAWFVVLVCMERFVVICFPLHTRRICTKTNALKGIAAVAVVAVVFSGIWTLSSEIINSQCITTFSTPETKLWATTLIVMGSFLIGILPMTILLLLTPIMCLVLYRYRRTRKRLASAVTPHTNNCVTKLSSMLITLCVTYVILQLPLILSHNLAKARGESVNTTDYLPLLALYKVGSVLEAANHSCNFFLYIACNSIFRRKVVNFVLSRRRSGSTVLSRSSDNSVSMTSLRINSRAMHATSMQMTS